MAASVLAAATVLAGLSARSAEGAAGWPAALAILLIGTCLSVAILIATRSASRVEDHHDDSVPLATIGDLVTWHDARGDVVRASATSAAILGTPARALSGDGFLARVHVSDRPICLTALSDAANGHRPVVATFRMRTGESETSGPDGRHDVIWTEMRAHRLRPAEAERSGAVVVAFTRDVSDLREQAEAAESARREAERANELKGRFLATVSHELRTPLNAIIGFSELLSADHPFLITEERRKEYAGIIRGSGHHLLEIVNTLLDMSKIESGNFNYEPERFDLRGLAASCCDLMQLRADEAGVRIERRLEVELPDILADRRACRQILINLVSNAVKFTPAGGLVTVSLAANADAVTLVVADTGMGIPEADLPRLGDPFFQSGEVHRRNHEGTGLGLSVVRGLVGLHRGQIVIESGAGAGTTVTVTLPIVGDAEAKPKPVTVQTRPRLAARQPERMSA